MNSEFGTRNSGHLSENVTLLSFNRKHHSSADQDILTLTFFFLPHLHLRLISPSLKKKTPTAKSGRDRFCTHTVSFFFSLYPSVFVWDACEAGTLQSDGIDSAAHWKIPFICLVELCRHLSWVPLQNLSLSLCFKYLASAWHPATRWVKKKKAPRKTVSVKENEDKKRLEGGKTIDNHDVPEILELMVMTCTRLHRLHTRPGPISRLILSPDSLTSLGELPCSLAGVASQVLTRLRSDPSVSGPPLPSPPIPRAPCAGCTPSVVSSIKSRHSAICCWYYKQRPGQVFFSVVLHTKPQFGVKRGGGTHGLWRMD